jgi:quinoprotein glucose dehydrogenase
LATHSQPSTKQTGESTAATQKTRINSTLKLINKANVKQLEIAWSYDTRKSGGLQTSPIEVNGVLYGISPSQRIFAFDAATGQTEMEV